MKVSKKFLKKLKQRLHTYTINLVAKIIENLLLSFTYTYFSKSQADVLFNIFSLVWRKWRNSADRFTLFFNRSKENSKFRFRYEFGYLFIWITRFMFHSCMMTRGVIFNYLCYNALIKNDFVQNHKTTEN